MPTSVKNLVNNRALIFPEAHGLKSSLSVYSRLIPIIQEAKNNNKQVILLREDTTDESVKEALHYGKSNENLSSRKERLKQNPNLARDVQLALELFVSMLHKLDLIKNVEIQSIGGKRWAQGQGYSKMHSTIEQNPNALVILSAGAAHVYFKNAAEIDTKLKAKEDIDMYRVNIEDSYDMYYRTIKNFGANNVGLCLQVEGGLKSGDSMIKQMNEGSAEIIHNNSLVIGNFYDKEKYNYVFQKTDPKYNPALTDECFSLIRKAPHVTKLKLQVQDSKPQKDIDHNGFEEFSKNIFLFQGDDASKKELAYCLGYGDAEGMKLGMSKLGVETQSKEQSHNIAYFNNYKNQFKQIKEDEIDLEYYEYKMGRSQYEI